MKYIYMNEFISDAEPEVPVIAVWDPNTKRLVYTDLVEVKDRHGVIIARVKFGQKPPKDLPHEAKSWVEVYEYASKVDVI